MLIISIINNRKGLNKGVIMKKIIFCLVAIFSIILFGLGFINKESIDVSNEQENTLNYGISGIPEDLEKLGDLSKRQEDIICAVSKGLVAKKQDNEIIPSLASEIITDKDGIQYEFKIRNDIFWSDGSKITPKDIIVFFKELLKEEDEGTITALLDVYGAKEFKEGKNIFETGVAIKQNDNSVIIRLNKKNENFLSELSKPQYRVRKYLIMWGNIKNNYDKLSYSGDYEINYMDKEKIELARNSYNGQFTKNSINIFNDESVEVSMASYEIKQRDIVINPPESEINKLIGDKKILTVPDVKATYLVINSKENYNQIEARREIFNNVYKAIVSYHDLNSYEFELAEGSYFRGDKENLTKLQARKVDMNKYGDWNRPEILTLLCKDNNQNRILCRVIQEWFEKYTNINLKYSLVKDEFDDEELKQRYDMLLVNSDSYDSNQISLYNNLEEYFTDNQRNILKKAEIEEINNDFSELETSLFNNYSILPLVFYNENIAISNKISDFNLDGNGNIDFQSIK